MEPIELGDVGPRAADLIGRAAAGEEFVITDAGRPVARLLPFMPHTWRPWGEIAGLFAGPGDPHRHVERDALADSVCDPWDHLTDR
ncbi:type II toxin-antitoxin system Phd/YefM family antitoxin [Mycobacterium adipatum]|uniref:type II toxin-antitoxin system Phd/YefM family antitoxin n=1 Tax=Mycobacterium adipatum TaxID=1682113 RepID=UPI0034E05BCD